MPNPTSLPEFAGWLNPLLKALRDLGGTARPQEAVDRVAQDEDVPDEVLDQSNQNGESRFRNQVHWARYYLVEAGYIDRSVRGVWRLTEKGAEAGELDGPKIRSLVDAVQHRVATLQVQKPAGSREGAALGSPSSAVSSLFETSTAPEEQLADHRHQLIESLRSLSPNGFERLCQRLLREAGFEEVEVTGRSGDGGIDGHGRLAVNAFVSFRVLFQCKRYEGAVGPGHIRDFRGALQGRADKGIILTTGTFTVDARREATRDGAPPIELVDAEKLIDLFEDLELGLRPRRTFDVNERFFDEYK